MVNSLSPGTLSCSPAYPQGLQHSRCSVNACWKNKQVNLTSANSLQISTPDWEGNWVWLWGESVQSHPRTSTDLRTAVAAAILSPSFPWRSPSAVSCYLIPGSALAPVCSDCLVACLSNWLGAPWREGPWASFLESHSLIWGSAPGIIAVCLSTNTISSASMSTSLLTWGPRVSMHLRMNRASELHLCYRIIQGAWNTNAWTPFTRILIYLVGNGTPTWAVLLSSPGDSFFLNLYWVPTVCQALGKPCACTVSNSYNKLSFWKWQ